MKKNDGTGLGVMPPSKQGSTAYEDAEPQGAGTGAGQGEGGTGPRVESHETEDPHGRRRK